MTKKIISIAAAAVITAGCLSGMASAADLTSKSYTIDFGKNDAGVMSDNQPIITTYNDKDRDNSFKVSNVELSGATATIKTGLFGKTATDQSLEATRTNSDITKISQTRVPHAMNHSNATWYGQFDPGTKIKHSFSFAFGDKSTNSYQMYIQMQADNDGVSKATDGVNYKGVDHGTSTFFKMANGKLYFFGKELSEYGIIGDYNVYEEKWYKADVIFTVGSTTVKNNAVLYLDGKKVASADFSLSKTTIEPMYAVMSYSYQILAATNKDNKVIAPCLAHDGTALLNVSHYIDDISWTPYLDADYEHSPINLVSNDENAVVLNGAVVLTKSMTVGEIKNAISAGKATISIVSAVTGETLQNTDVVDEAMLKLTDASIGDIFYKIGKIMLYSEDFEADDGFIEGKPYKYWESFDLKNAPDAKPAIVENVGGKSGKSYAISTESILIPDKEGYKWLPVGDYVKGKKNVISHCADENAPLVIEAMFNNTQKDYVSSVMRIGYMIGGKQYEANSISVAANSVINCCGIDVAKAKKQGLWQKVALVIDPKTKTADIYLDGVKMNEKPQPVYKDSEGNIPEGKIDGISMLWLRTWSANTKQLDGYSAFDDIKIYNGYYDAEKDAATVSSINDDVTVENGIISIPAAYNPTTLKKALVMAEGTTVKFYTDATFTTECKAVLPITTGAWMAEYAPGGAIHYYQIVTPKGVSSFEVPKLYIDGIEVTELPVLAQEEKAGLQAVVEMNKWNDEDVTVCVLALYDEEGTMVDLATVGCSGTGYNRVELNLRDITSFEGITAKAFVWNSIEGLIPVGDMVEVK